MSTYGSVELAVQNLDQASERLGYLLQRANGPQATADDRQRAAEAALTRAACRRMLLDAIHQHAHAQHQAGIDLGRSERRSA